MASDEWDNCHGTGTGTGSSSTRRCDVVGKLGSETRAKLESCIFYAIADSVLLASGERINASLSVAQADLGRLAVRFLVYHFIVSKQ